MSNIIDSIKLSGVTYTIQGSGGGGNPTVELTQAEYDALVTAGTVSPNTYYIIADASGGDLSNYMSSAQTMSAITEATSGKVDSNVYTAYTASTDTAIQGKQDTLVSGTNIKTINNTSILGSGNIDIQGGGGGKAISGGTNISITTGETVDTINCTLPISAYTASSNHVSLTVFGTQNTISHANSSNNFIVGSYNKLGSVFDDSSSNYIFGSNNSLDKGFQDKNSDGNFVVGNYNSLGKNYGEAVSYCKIFGSYLNPKNYNEIVFGQYNNSVSASTTFGDSGNTFFSVGNGTADNARHNAFEIRQNGDIYITSGGTDIKLQDNLGGGGGGEGTVSALTETNLVALKNYTYYTATTIDTIYLISKFDSTFYDYYTMGGYLSDDGYFEIYTSGNENGITSVSASTAFTSTITDGIAEIKFVSPLTLKQINNLRNRFIAYYFPPTPYTSGSTSEVVEGAVYDSLRKLSLDVLQKDGINDYYIYATDDGIGFNLRTDKDYYSGNLALASPTINFNGGKLNTQFSSTTASQVVINNGYRDYCTLFHSKSYDDITITFNPSYNGGVTQANFTIYAQISEYQSVPKYFAYDIANNSISWSSSDWNTYFTVVDTLSTDHKLKIIANTGYKIVQFSSSECLICGVDHPKPNSFVVTLVTTTSNIHDGQEIIDDLYANKQDKLSAGTNITIVDNVISAEGGGSITIDPTLDSGSTNAVANSAITTAINDKANKTAAVGGYGFGSTSDNPWIQLKSVSNSNIGNTIYYPRINGKVILTNNGTYAGNNYNFQLVETSAITTSITSSSTDAEIPSAKCVYDTLGGLKLVKLTQSAYDALNPNYDSNTLYVIVN